MGGRSRRGVGEERLEFENVEVDSAILINKLSTFKFM